jgi:hypothetical protein
VNAVIMAKSVKKQLEILDKGEGLSLSDFRFVVTPSLQKQAPTNTEKIAHDKVLKEMFDLFDENSKLISFSHSYLENNVWGIILR